MSQYNFPKILDHFAQTENEYELKFVFFLIHLGNQQDGKAHLKDYGRDISTYSYSKKEYWAKIVKWDTQLVDALQGNKIIIWVVIFYTETISIRQIHVCWTNSFAFLSVFYKLISTLTNP